MFSYWLFKHWFCFHSVDNSCKEWRVLTCFHWVWSADVGCLICVKKKQKKPDTLDSQSCSIFMCNLWLKLNSIIYLSSTISPLSVLYALLSRPPLLLSLALSSNLTLMLTHFVTPRWLPLSLPLSRSLPLSLALFLSLPLSLSIAWRTRVPADAFLSRAPPLPLSLSLTLSNSLHLSPTLSFTHTHIHTHIVLSTKLENKGRRGNRGIKVHRGGK